MSASQPYKNSPPQSGIKHWWMQRLSSIVLVPLALWFCWSLLMLDDLGLTTLMQWMQSPVTAVLLIIFLIVTGYHAAVGMQVVVEDYIHVVWLKVASLSLISILMTLAIIVGVLAVLNVFFRELPS